MRVPAVQAYLAELLRIEGINWVAIRDLASVPLSSTEPLPPVVLCGPIPLDASEAERLAQHVRQGGCLLMSRPAPALAAALDLAPPLLLWTSAYVGLVDGDPIVGELPWPDEGVQCFGHPCALLPHAADQWQTAAWLGPYAGQRSRFPAVQRRVLGSGRVVAFSFDLAESAVQQHQGQARQSSSGPLPDFDGDGSFRATELFLGQLDPRLRDAPQADLLRTLFIRAIEWLTEDMPLPRLWRLPHNWAAAALFDGDSDSMTRDDFRLAIETCDRYRAPFTTFLKPEHVELLDAAEVQEQRERGHAFGPHPWAGPQPTPEALRAVLEADCAAFAAKYGYRPRVHRGHWVIWPGWADHARSLAGAGIRLDGNFTAGRYFKGGYVNGSGLPLRFVDEDGTLLDVAEQSTISTDDGWLSGKNDLPALTIAEAISRSCQQIDDALARWHTVVHPYFHPVCLKGGRALPYPTLPWLESMLAHCKRRGVPFLHPERWIDWNDARREVSLADYTRTGRGVSFRVAAGQTITGATLLLPVPAGARPRVRVDGDVQPDEQALTERQGRTYAAATLDVRAGDARTIEVGW